VSKPESAGDGWNKCGRSDVELLGHWLGSTKMRLLLALIIIIYLVGVGVVLSPTVRSTWDSAPASALAQSIAQELPNALAWPVRAAHAIRGS
jgi:hypothetical protein